MKARMQFLLFVLAYALFTAIGGLILNPQGLMQRVTESLSFRVLENLAITASYLVCCLAVIRSGTRTAGHAWLLVPHLALLVCQALLFFFDIGLLEPWSLVVTVLHLASGLFVAEGFMFWADLSRYFDIRAYQLAVLGGSLLSSLLFILVTALTGAVVAFAVKMVLILASVVASGTLLYQLEKWVVPRRRNTGEIKSVGVGWGDRMQSVSTRRFSKSVRSMLVSAICTGAIGYTYAFSWAHTSNDPSTGVAFAVGESFAVAFLIFLAAVPELFSSFSVSKSFVFLCPIACICSILAFLSSDRVAVYCTALNSSLYHLYLVVLLPLCAAEGKRENIPVPALYAVCQCIVTPFVMLGYCVSAVVEETMFVGTASTLSIMGIALALDTVLSSVSNDKNTSMLFSPTQKEQAEQVVSQSTGRKATARQIAAEYGLTARETDVLCLMMDGRDLPVISSELSISRNTVKTHIKHIYGKLGITSRQELIDLAERYERLAEALVS